MPNKIIIVVLTFLLIIIGALGAYSFNLNKEIVNLDKEIVALTELQEDTDRQISSMQVRVYSLNAKIDSLKEDIASQITGIEDIISALSTKIEDISSSTDTERLYQQTKESVVEIANEVTGNATGSGFVFDDEGHIVTAYHVVKEANKVDIILHNGTISAASVVGYCLHSDIAVLKPEKAVVAEGLSLADSNTTAIGEPVIAIGSPFELSGTVTSGIVSQKDRFIEVEYNENELRWVANIIQSDTSVNFGNSGGPLINAEGEVIGLVVARVNPREGDGIYYAVSSNKLKRVVTSIIDHGYFDYPWLGVGLADLSPQEARARQLDTINGVRVTATLDGPATPAGVKVNDIIVAIDDTTIHSTAELTSYLGEYKSPQEMTTLIIIRNGEELKLSVQLDKRR
ncbi:MAG: hypothetical protein CL875_05890 [Dehalococcoidales bacterium]|jgi:S1-C subfamily serine protease|nr:hypothetical protein [Dehalococcoidales bacterium]|tara:strand:- start:268 stop:1464 length:1197 start_codon:yes stop_codon:yes gene_type:complete